jgi:hypothetical protein
MKYQVFEKDEKIDGLAEGDAYYGMKGRKTHLMEVDDVIAKKLKDGWNGTLKDGKITVSKSTHVIEKEAHEDWKNKMRNKLRDGTASHKDLMDILLDIF